MNQRLAKICSGTYPAGTSILCWRQDSGSHSLGEHAGPRWGVTTDVKLTPAT